MSGVYSICSGKNVCFNIKVLENVQYYSSEKCLVFFITVLENMPCFNTTVLENVLFQYNSSGKCLVSIQQF